MLVRFLIRTACGLLAACFIPIAGAQDGKDVPAADARIWLERIHSAASPVHARTGTTRCGEAVSTDNHIAG